MALPSVDGASWTAMEVGAVAVLAGASVAKRMLSRAGGTVAFLMGAVVVLATDLAFLLLMVSLLALAAGATRLKYEEKRALGVEEGAGGVRRTRNVLANGLAATVVAASFPLLVKDGVSEGLALAFAACIGAAASDTLASELGGLSKRVYGITTLRRVPPGTDGGVSLGGQAAALGAAAAIAALAVLLLGVLSEAPLLSATPWTFGVLTLAGFLGCQVDSVLGALLEMRGRMTKEEVNLAGTSFGGAFAYAAWWFAGA